MSPKTLLVALCAAVALTAAAGTGSVVIPTDVQLRWADYEVGAIGHFLPISNQHGCRDATAFDPHNLDTDSWVRAIAQFGAKYAVFVVRHTCGFCLWPTNATVAETGFAYEHSIKLTSTRRWRAGTWRRSSWPRVASTGCGRPSTPPHEFPRNSIGLEG